MNKFLLTVSVLVLSAGAAFADDHTGEAVREEAVQEAAADAVELLMAKAEILNGAGEVIGAATFTQGTVGILADISVNGLPPGKHGMHMHAVGSCDHEGHFKSASGHINPDGKEHGYLNPKGPEKGDLPNINVNEEGSALLELFMPQLDVNDLLDEDGSALMIHESPDDHKTQPIGGSGARIACGVVKGM